ncbi:hypothetical protein [Actinomycetospora termitidis]|uniref:Uncharacterized protein n=1 Tax=Actinomycetospora termitidis TaxID=3053470 RepID=A0ABT7MFI7_9PSEU|nr:hypothetical protein [Actinomycetospora sp. Odt1-22]MDL5159443.1 hypothetical protein [Actinomycetospora sp. Odt1-22]
MSTRATAAALLPVAVVVLFVAAGAGVLGVFYPMIGWALVALFVGGGVTALVLGERDRRRARRGGER